VINNKNKWFHQFYSLKMNNELDLKEVTFHNIIQGLSDIGFIIEKKRKIKILNQKYSLNYFYLQEEVTVFLFGSLLLTY